jgi:heptosyltransferase I
MADILFVKTSSLGDVVHHMPAVTEARRYRPDARLTWVVEEPFAPLVALHPAVGNVIPVASRRWRNALYRSATWKEMAQFYQTIRARSYDRIIDTQGLFRSALIAGIARGQRHGYDSSSVKERAACLFYDVRYGVDRGRHAIARNRELTGLALGYSPEGAADFGLDRASLAGSTHQQYAILLHATAQADKQWDEHGWSVLARALVARGLVPVLLWGTDIERERSHRIAMRVPQARVADRQPLNEVARLIAGASLVVGVDTGLLHLAAALSVPLVAIFRASEPGLTGPMGNGSITVIGRNGLSPDIDDVVAAAESALETT